MEKTVAFEMVEGLREEIERLKTGNKLREGWLEGKVKKLEQKNLELNSENELLRNASSNGIVELLDMQKVIIENQELKKRREEAEDQLQVLINAIVSHDQIDEFVEWIKWTIEYEEKEYPESNHDWSAEMAIIEELENI